MERVMKNVMFVFAGMTDMSNIGSKKFASIPDPQRIVYGFEIASRQVQMNTKFSDRQLPFLLPSVCHYAVVLNHILLEFFKYILLCHEVSTRSISTCHRFLLMFRWNVW
ncbi:hypothetical protein PsorP6_000732 [Peronosclerospora sorghi]|uniref:Uncharacterized protein n=1 Tax=Peronosclerospora sorghi TaxID=230839 RepID=A0ACC0WSF0_9STRA|nr:hypothetical protein PsorP6_000732 [Peronosclerospora sorghi]